MGDENGGKTDRNRFSNDRIFGFTAPKRFFGERKLRAGHRHATSGERNPPVSTPPVPLARLAKCLSDPARWIILRELGRGEPLPVKELARRAGCSADMASKHMAVLRAAAVVVTGYGRLYQLAPAYRPAPGAGFIDFGPCQLRIAPPPGADPE